MKYNAENKKACDLENQLKQTKRELQQLESANRDLNKKMTDKEKEQEQLKSKCEATARDLNNMKSQLSDVQTKHASAKDKVGLFFF